MYDLRYEKRASFSWISFCVSSSLSPPGLTLDGCAFSSLAHDPRDPSLVCY